jgi:dihydroorotase
LVQHAFNALFEMYHQGKISLEKIAEKTAHNLAICFQIKDRGFIREGYYADLALVDLNASYQVNKNNILSKCGWSPFEGDTFNSKITHTFVSGHLAFADDEFNESILGERLRFDR